MLPDDRGDSFRVAVFLVVGEAAEAGFRDLGQAAHEGFLRGLVGDFGLRGGGAREREQQSLPG